MTTEAAATLAAIASSPGAVAVSQAHLFAAVDALAAVYRSEAPADLNERQRAMRSERAVWRAIQTHAEHRARALAGEA